LMRPDVNRSHRNFTVEQIPSVPTRQDQEPGTRNQEPELGIRYGLTAVKNVGSAAVDSLIAEREKNGPFKSLDDLCRRVDLSAKGGLNKRAIESLIKCGAMDDFGPRERVLAGLEPCIAAGQQHQRAAGLGQTSLFDMMGSPGSEQDSLTTALPLAPPLPQRKRLEWEKESL